MFLLGLSHGNLGGKGEEETFGFWSYGKSVSLCMKRPNVLGQKFGKSLLFNLKNGLKKFVLIRVKKSVGFEQETEHRSS